MTGHTPAPACTPAVPELVALATTTSRTPIDADALHRMLIGAAQAGVPWEWAMRVVMLALIRGEDLHDIRTGLYARQPGKQPRTT
jgi:hypothetical protein